MNIKPTTDAKETKESEKKETYEQLTIFDFIK